jgi:hypothetical protein
MAERVSVTENQSKVGIKCGQITLMNIMGFTREKFAMELRKGPAS